MGGACSCGEEGGEGRRRGAGGGAATEIGEEQEGSVVENVGL